uniref:menin-like n=1 Tax=Ciona intestinalis TaxID=7719 RepID=UPI000180C435|nr:menin-like [Ciona intestinalis]|eukprot:XP_009858293.1 menin-like [Ciona intestinalis]
MSEIRVEERAFFPITSLSSFIGLVKEHLQHAKLNPSHEPNLALLSILFGYLEHELTVSRTASVDSSTDSEKGGKPPDKITDSTQSIDDEFPTLDLEIIEGLYNQFVLMIKAQVDKSLTEFTSRSGYATRMLCKRVSDVIWNGLLRSYHKDKPHIQSLFSYLTGRQLDCFGLAFVVVAACQVLAYKDAHLVLSGDHAWVATGEDSKDMTEVTWHGKGLEDRRGFLIDKTTTEKNWIYHGGNAVKCDRWMEVVALVTSLNAAIDMQTDSEELQLIQHDIMRYLYEEGHMDKYPMALGVYAELKEIIPTNKQDSATVDEIHNKAITAVETIYDGLHFLPYVSKGHSCARRNRYDDAIRNWSKAAQVLSRYNYGKEDEESYKEMIDIANDLIPSTLKTVPQLCEDTQCYYNVIQFYDGICLWEEGSVTPVLHSWWARHFTNTISKFTPEVRQFYSDGNSSPSKPVAMETTRMNRRSSKGASLSSPSRLAYSSSTSEDGQDPKTLDDTELTEALAKPVTKLNIRSEKMRALSEMLISGKKVNSQAIGLLLTAQSQVHFVKRKSNAGDYSVDYGDRSKIVRKSKDLD